MSNILIVGMGVVGNNLYKELITLNPDICDKYKSIQCDKTKIYDIAFICVDTPSNDKSLCDITEVRNAIEENNARIYVIKSTVLPGTTEVLRDLLHKNIIFSPEYYGGTQHCNNFNFNFTILGGDKYDCVEVIQQLQKVYDATYQFKITDSRTAELAKYMENAFLATKVSFCNEFYDIAMNLGVCYEELRELFILDPRVNPSHTFVYQDKPYWDSHCLNKDVKALAEGCNSDFFRYIVDYNNKRKDT